MTKLNKKNYNYNAECRNLTGTLGSQACRSHSEWSILVILTSLPTSLTSSSHIPCASISDGPE